MKNYFATITILLFALLTLTFSCTKPTTIGAGLQDTVDVNYTDTLTLRMTTIREDSVKTFDPNLNAPFLTHLCGNYNDQVLGKTEASIFTQIRFSTTSIPDAFFDADLDSIVLHLAYDSLAFYGDISQTYSFSVFRMLEDMEISQTYNSKDNFEFDEASPLASFDFQPAYDSTELVNYTTLDSAEIETYRVAPQLRIPLSTEIGEELLSAGHENLDTIGDFLNYFKGIYIKSTSENDGMLGFRLNSALSGVTVYYHKGDSIQNFYTFASNQNTVKTTHVVTEFSPEVEEAFGNVSKGDSVLYLQGLAGPNIKIEFPYADALENKIINKAELVFTVSSEEDELRRTPVLVAAATRDADGAYSSIEDFLFAFDRGSLDIFGGQLEENDGMREYRFNISSVFQELVDGGNEPLYLRILPKQEQVTRMTLFGPKHSQYPAKLNLTYTDLPD